MEQNERARQQVAHLLRQATAEAQRAAVAEAAEKAAYQAFLREGMNKLSGMMARTVLEQAQAQSRQQGDECA
jgi:hypothetical protein